MELAQDVQFLTAWQSTDANVQRSAREFWEQSGLPVTMIDRRMAELCSVAYADGKMVAVSTAINTNYPYLSSNLYFYRCMVSSAYRQKHLAYQITLHSRDVLAKWSQEHPEENVRGLMMFMETEKFASGLRPPVRLAFGMAFCFVGYSDRGEQRRVVWFDHVQLPLNAP